jgi:predicted alpha/beta-hydrolase family hydrolase
MPAGSRSSSSRRSRRFSIPSRGRTIDIDTPYGPARAHARPHTDARAALVLGHGAGGGVNAPDLLAASRAAMSREMTVVLVEQPYRVAGRRTPAPVHHLDAAWIAVVGRLRQDVLAATPLVVGGRSSGARVACRTAAAVGAVGVVCLAFPLRPPGRRDAPSRLPELDAVAVPTLVVQGEHDPFGMPPGGRLRTVVQVAGDHGLKAEVASVESAVHAWLAEVLALVG